MTDLAIITPTRGRPREFARLVEAVDRTSTMDVVIWAGLDTDDTTDYFTALRGVPGNGRVYGCKGERRSLRAWTNELAEQALDAHDPPRYLASLGDDHVPRTPDWDRRLCGAIDMLPGGEGIAYGNDLLQGERVPTAWVMSAGLVRALGWMMVPVCDHMYVDDAIAHIGRWLNLITYRPDVVIEHVHPLAGKTPWDDSYRLTNARDRMAKDKRAYIHWRESGAAAEDIQRARVALDIQARAAVLRDGG